MDQLNGATAPRFDSFEKSPDGSVTAFTTIPLEPGTVRRLTDKLFVENWSRIVVGPCMQGAVFEIRFVEAPQVRYSDGYLTVDLGPWHFHLCVEQHKGSRSEELRRIRPVAKAAFWEQRPLKPTNQCGCGGRSWGLRFWNGYGEQMTTVFLPNARLTDDMQMLKHADWSRLALYYQLRSEFLGEPVPEDFEATATLPLPGLVVDPAE
jgi:hypothetical protein